MLRVAKKGLGRSMERMQGTGEAGALGYCAQRDVSSSAVHDMQAAGGQPAAAHAGAIFSPFCSPSSSELA